jgi:hypothetical protein
MDLVSFARMSHVLEQTKQQQVRALGRLGWAASRIAAAVHADRAILPGSRPRKRTSSRSTMKRGVQVVNERAVHLLVEIRIEGLERALGITEARELVPALEQTVLAPAEFVGTIADMRSRGARSALVGAAFPRRRPCQRSAVAGAPDRVQRDSLGVSCAIDDIAIEGELPNERIDLLERQRHRRPAFEIAAEER